MSKRLIDWFEDLNKLDIKSLAVRELLRQNRYILNHRTATFCNAINTIAWDETRHGSHFWSGLNSLHSDGMFQRENITNTSRIEQLISEHLQRAAENVDFKEDSSKEIDRRLITGIKIIIP